VINLGKLEGDILDTALNEIETRSHVFGAMEVIIGILRKVKIDEWIDDTFTKKLGHTPDIPYSVIGLLFISLLAFSRKPLYHIKTIFKKGDGFDFKGTFGFDIDPDKMTDDRYALFLDHMAEVNPEVFFSKVTLRLIKEYDISLENINNDTTSLITWGAYESSEGVAKDVFHLDYGHSKQKRPDKKQLKIGMSHSNGILVAPKLLAGNMDDKSYMTGMAGTLLDDLKDLGGWDNSNYFLIADSAAGSEEMFITVKERNLKLITRLSDGYLVAKEKAAQFSNDLSIGKEIVVETVGKRKDEEKSRYLYHESEGVHKGHHLKLGVYLSYPLMATKTVSVGKKIKKEAEKVATEIKKLNKSKPFACLKDAETTQKAWLKTIKSPTYHDVKTSINEIEKAAPGRRSKNPENQKMVSKFELRASFELKENHEDLKKQEIIRQSIFVLASTDLKVDAETMLKEYKTQNSIEVTFGQLKSSEEFVNSVFLKKTERVSSLMYLTLIALQVCCVIQRQVREGLHNDRKTITEGSGKKQSRPTFVTILNKFETISRQIRALGGHEKRKVTGITEEHELILSYLHLDTSIF
jgi:transposase